MKEKRTKLLVSIIATLLILLILIIALNVTKVSTTKANKNNKDNCTSTNNKCSKEDLEEGVKVSLKVNDTETYEFYIIDNDEFNVTLMMDKKLEEVNYADENNLYGPVTLLEKLSEKTKDWENVDLIDFYNYADLGLINLMSSNEEYDASVVDDAYSKNPGGYSNLMINNGIATLVSSAIENANNPYIFENKFRARLITYEELENLKVNGKYPDWLVENLENDEGYWTLTSKTGTKDNKANAYAVMNKNSKTSITDKKVNEHIGIRPVITVSKEKLN